MNKPIIAKVAAYITQADRLLLFRHTQYPEAGIQVPAGTLRPGETPLEGALREAREESGLADLKLVSFLGEVDFDCTPYGKDQIHHRSFYHFEAPDGLPETWRHMETDPTGSPGEAFEFEFFWANLPGGVPALTGEQDALLPALHRSRTHAGYIRRCYALARSALAKGNHPFGALLVKDGQVVLEAENTVNSGRDVTRHAELNLVSLASSSLAPEVLAGCTLYTSTEPCVMCSGAIYWAGIPEIVFGVAAESLAGRAGERFVLNSRTVLGQGRSKVRVEGPVLPDEGDQVYQGWL